MILSVGYVHPASTNSDSPQCLNIALRIGGGACHDVHFELKTPSADTPGLSEPINIAVFRLVQEALTNAVRHSHPRRVAIGLVRRRSTNAEDEELVLTIGNDGAICGGRRPQMASA